MLAKSDLEEDYNIVKDESDMILTGIWLSSSKSSTAQLLKPWLVQVTIDLLTGDNDKVTQAVCEKVGLDVDNILLGVEVDALSDEDWAKQ